MTEKAGTVLILGGAGFIGSHIVNRFFFSGYSIIVIDGLLAQTGGRKDNLQGILSDIHFIHSQIEDVNNLNELIKQCNIIIDCMGWTSHKSALSDPISDLRLNAGSHLYLIPCLRKYPDRRIIFLGSRAQYGNPAVTEITEKTPMIPEDIHGIHKVAAESYYRIYSKLYNLNIVSLRIPNCFGENQPFEGDDIGLIGGFIRDILYDRKIEIYGKGRKRYLTYVKDVAEVVFHLEAKPVTGFHAYNMSGHEIPIEEIVRRLIRIIGKGTYIIKEMPAEVKAIDIGSAKFSELKLRNFLGKVPSTALDNALYATVRYFRERLQ